MDSCSSAFCRGESFASTPRNCFRAGRCTLAHIQTVSNATFGPLVAYLIPGAIVLLGLSPFSPLLQSWFGAATESAPTIGGFLFLTVASLAVGMTVNGIRWVIVDTLHAMTGLPAPPPDFSRLGRNVEAYNLLIQIHYFHFQFHGNMVIATALAYISHRVHLGWHGGWGWFDFGTAVLELIFYVSSRDTLKKYHTRGRQLLQASSSRDRTLPAR